MIKLWVDGACTPSGIYTGLGAWSYLVLSKGLTDVEVSNAEWQLDTTNNRMEIEAVIQGLNYILETKHLYDDKNIMVYSDSNIVVNTLCKGATFKKKKNVDKWDEAEEKIKLLEMFGFDIDFMWVKAHTKDMDEVSVRNRFVDNLAQTTRDKGKEELSFL